MQVGRDLRGEDGEVPPSKIGGACSRCGRSYLRRDEDGGLCRDCRSAASRRAEETPAARRPESPSVGATSSGGPSALPTCSVDDCTRAPSAFGKCRTHLDEERAAAPKKSDPAHPWNKYVEKKTQAFALEVAPDVKPELPELVAVKEEAVVVAKAERIRCGVQGCDFSSDRPQAVGAHKRYAHGPGKQREEETPVVEKKDAKPATSSTATSSPRTSSPPKKLNHQPIDETAAAKVNGAAIPPEVELMLLLGALDAETRSRVVSWAHTKWGGV